MCSLSTELRPQNDLDPQPKKLEIFKKWNFYLSVNFHRPWNTMFLWQIYTKVVLTYGHVWGTSWKLTLFDSKSSNSISFTSWLSSAWRRETSLAANMFKNKRLKTVDAMKFFEKFREVYFLSQKCTSILSDCRNVFSVNYVRLRNTSRWSIEFLLLFLVMSN